MFLSYFICLAWTHGRGVNLQVNNPQTQSEDLEICSSMLRTQHYLSDNEVK